MLARSDLEVTTPPRHASSMFTRLTLEATPEHHALDDALLASLAAPSVGAYRHFLARVYGFAAPVGVVLLATPGLDAELLASRVRAGWIASDLLGLGLTRSESTMLRRRIEVPAFASPAEALGWLYATERITLRHDRIRTCVRTALPATFEIASDYLMSTGGRAHVQWRQLGRALDRAAANEEAAARMLAGAHAAFVVQRRWVEETAYDGF